MKKLIFLSVIALGCLVTLSHRSVLSAQSSVDDLNGQINKIGQALFYIREYYLDTLDSNAFVDDLLERMVERLDPHSAFIPEKDVKAINEPFEGNFEGIGIEFTIIRDTLVVAQPVAGAPSEKVGVRADDRIVAVDGEDICNPDLNNQKVYSLLRGPKGTRVALKVIRPGEPEPLYFEVVRDKIPITSIDASYMAAPGVMYIKLNKFALTTQEEFINAFRDLSEKPRGLIIDLCGNSGGMLGAALFLAEQFLQKDQLILYTEGANMPRQDIKATGNGFFTEIPVVIMIDEGSASASEIVAGAIQDWDRGVVVGRRSFGKGLVQQAFTLRDGSELRLTIARYHTPSGRVIQSPYKLGEKDAYYSEFLQRYLRGEQFSADSIQIPDSLAFKTLRDGRTVYGAGGIMPDVFVPADTTFYSGFYFNLVRRGIINDFMNSYLDVERKDLTAVFPGLDDFEKGFGTDDVPFEELLSFAQSRDVVPGEGDLAVSEQEIRLQVKGLIAGRLYGPAGYYRIVNPGLPVFRKALEVMNGMISPPSR
ncbi:MAG: S41 family peptidase [Bacteroidales bacterium]|nr:S41 family peptidase [Bacteroidales bacterium]MDD4654169.1 S41 family peptidase [Bacteroidales bacterium]